MQPLHGGANQFECRSIGNTRIVKANWVAGRRQKKRPLYLVTVPVSRKTNHQHFVAIIDIDSFLQDDVHIVRAHVVQERNLVEVGAQTSQLTGAIPSRRMR